ncbi:MAG: hypothetical protein IPP07_03440 [Holophagales bacterium]|nr:hypothetical protein [Holophagales bacterium]
MPSLNVTGLGPGFSAAGFGLSAPGMGLAAEGIAVAGGGSRTFVEPFRRAPR